MRKIPALIFILIILFLPAVAQMYNDATLARVRSQDSSSRDGQGRLLTLTATEHAYRADVYSTNRAFPEAREHWQKILDNFSSDQSVMPRALFGVGRSYMWERQYEKALTFFELVVRDYLTTKEGREGLAFKGACLIRLGRDEEAAKTYAQYTSMFPYGERIETSYLNIIDALREARKYDDANAWVNKARSRFPGMPTETNALQARVRIEMFRQNWGAAADAAAALLSRNVFSGSMTSRDEIAYLKAFSLEKAGRRQEAIEAYSSIPDNLNSYYGGLAAEKLRLLNPARGRLAQPVSYSASAREYPAPFRDQLLKYTSPLGVDPRFVLAVMKQESTFRPGAKSPSAARGLLQLTLDTALKYNKRAGFPAISDDDLYRPEVNIAIGTLYIAELKKQFDNLYEAIAASYNGGEDNAGRWLARSKPKDPGIFTAEVGFAESKAYVLKVMNNYRAYRELYTENLTMK
jgi:soluble lytic murein transglycosylase